MVSYVLSSGADRPGLSFQGKADCRIKLGLQQKGHNILIVTLLTLLAVLALFDLATLRWGANSKYNLKDSRRDSVS
jgi:hypothetical protein